MTRDQNNFSISSLNCILLEPHSKAGFTKE